MQNDPDYHMALLLQQEFNREFNSTENSPKISSNNNNKKNKSIPHKSSLIDPSWELVDPTPNIFLLFTQFNEKFFWNKLGSVAVAWSKRMTSCAGICSYRSRGGLCNITLSEPLLKLRPRKDLIETLLHEMIHALLFVTHNNKDRDGHGPEFHKHMYRINGEAGTNITVYHDFHDEVRLYKQHWWRCNGSCQKRPPFFGMVRRAMNRAPGPYDRWFAEHQLTCGGNFIKVKEPENYKKKQDKNKNNNTGTISSSNKNTNLNTPTKTNLPDIRNFIPGSSNSNSGNTNIQTINSVQTKGGLGTKNKNGTVVLNPKNAGKGNDMSVSSVIPSSSNIVGFSKDVDKIPARNNVEVFSGSGKKLNESSKPRDSSTPPDYNLVRNHWANKFPGSSESNNQNNIKRKSISSDSEVTKKPKTQSEIDNTFAVTCPNCNKFFVDSEINSHLDSCLNSDDSIKSEFSNDSLTMVECPICKIVIEEELLNGHLDECLSCNNKGSENAKLCELCNTYISSDSYTLHVQDCLNNCYDNIEKNLKIETNASSDSILCLVCNKNIMKGLLNDHLEECMVSVFDKDNFKDVDEEDDDEIGNEPLNKSIYNCPICMSTIDENNMNSHIDECLNTEALKNEFID